jgi:Xaa-Pro aminopeptidase
VSDVYADRRARVLTALGEHGALVLPAAPELRVGLDGEVRYVVDASLYYLTGYREPEAVLVLCPSADAPFTFFVRARDPERELWTGGRGGVDDATARFRADAAFPIGELAQRLPKLLAGADTLFGRLGVGRPDVDALLLGALERARRARPRTGRGPRALVDPGALLDDMRLRKEPCEIERMRAAARITVDAFRDAAAIIRPGAAEYEVEAALDAGFRRRGADGPAFPTIVASGTNATVLHYVANTRTLRAGELVLLDAGARMDYCGDVSRTLPVSGSFTAAQRALYEGVRGALCAGVAAARPGATIDDVHDAARARLVDALVDLGFLAGPADAYADEERAAEVKRFYPHRTSHWLGLDVHDVGDYVVDGAPRRLEPGMVFTVEPGLYIPADAAPGPAELYGTGIRIEDDVLITADGHEVLTRALPTGTDAVAGLWG